MEDNKEKIYEFIHPMHDKKNNVLYEYYDRMSYPQDSDILGNLEVWIYGNDRADFTPHCHVRTHDNKFEFEVSLLTWEVVNIKNSNLPNSWDSIGNKIKDSFFAWLNRKPKEGESSTNKTAMFVTWNQTNVENTLSKWVNENSDVDEDLLYFLGLRINCVKLRKTVIEHLTHIYFVDKNARYELHKMKPQELLNTLSININLQNNQEAIDAVIEGEKQVYTWSSK